MSRRILILVTLLMFSVLAISAHADSIASWYITGTNSPGSLPCSLAAPCAEVSLDINTAGTNATFTVTSLLDGWVFDKFGFNTGGALVALVAGSGFGEVGAYSLGGSGTEDGWGKFDYNFLTGKDGGSSGGDCSGNPGHPAGGCTFGFMLSSTTSLSLSTFEHAPSGQNIDAFFAGHMASNSNSGYAGSPLQFIPVSEPAMLMILTPGLLTAAGLLIRPGR